MWIIVVSMLIAYVAGTIAGKLVGEHLTTPFIAMFWVGYLSGRVLSLFDKRWIGLRD